MEHIVLNRLENYTEDNVLIPVTMVGWTANLSTQNVMIRLKRDTIDRDRHKYTRAVLALDLNKAFDNVSQRIILENLSSINPGIRKYNYIRSFLFTRTDVKH